MTNDKEQQAYRVLQRRTQYLVERIAGFEQQSVHPLNAEEQARELTDLAAQLATLLEAMDRLGGGKAP